MVERRRRLRRLAHGLGALLLAWLVLAYFLLPWAWWLIERGRHPELASLPVRTTNADGIPGGPVNVALIGTRGELIGAMIAAQWYPADPITLRSSLDIAASVLLHRPDPDAPVSPLYLFGRKQDLAFEQDVGGSADHRHHVRWWLTDRTEEGRHFWLGAASYDRDSGLSHLTGQITHHIGPDVDAERDRLMAGLAGRGLLEDQYQIPGMGPTTNAHNAGGDRFYTDGMIDVGVLAAGDSPR